MGLSCNSAKIWDRPNALAKKSPHKAFPATALVQQVVLIPCCEATQASKKSLAVFSAGHEAIPTWADQESGIPWELNQQTR